MKRELRSPRASGADAGSDPSRGRRAVALDGRLAGALGAALDRARHVRALAEAEAARAGVECALAEVLAAHPGRAFVVDTTGRVHPVNERAERALAADPEGTLARVVAAVGEPGASELDVLPVRMGERVDRVVVIERPSSDGALEDRVERAATAWCLTARQREILDRTARGMSNKEIASDLGCAEVTVENHLTAIFRKAAVDGRSRLLVKLATL